MLKLISGAAVRLFQCGVSHEYGESPWRYPIGIIVVGLVTYKVVQWLLEDEEGRSVPVAEDGPLRDMILPSRCLKRKSSVFQTNRIVEISDLPTAAEWRPVLVFANRKSGSNQGEAVLKRSRELLHPVQVHDLNYKQPSVTLALCKLLPQTQFVIVICGGDGTVNWMLSEIDSLNLDTDPLIAVMPIGTGNDIANFLKWGYTLSENEIESYFQDLRLASTVSIDRWRVETHLTRRSLLSFTDHQDVKHITNYFSIGCDALSALKFHEDRVRRPEVFMTRIVNRLFYAGYIFIDTLEQNCKDLSDKIELVIDEDKVELPQLEGLIFLNIPFWAGGCRIWDNKLDVSQWKSVDPGDGIIEVIGLSSTFHMAQILAKMSQPIRLGQARSATLTIKCPVPAQTDGEPWRQDPCRIDIRRGRRILALERRVN